MAVIQQQHRTTPELAERDRRGCPAERVTARSGKHEGIPPHHVPLEIAHVGLKGEHGSVEAARLHEADERGSLLLDPVQRELRESPA